MIDWDMLEQRQQNKEATTARYYKIISDIVAGYSPEEIDAVLKRGIIFNKYNDVYDIVQKEVNVTEEELTYLEDECDEEFGAEWIMFGDAEQKVLAELQEKAQ